MEIRQLRAFVRVAEVESISAAADQLNIAQPALSRQIQGLEAEMGLRLFHRHGRGVQLTEAGRTLLARAMVILREVEQARDELRGEEAQLRGEVSFALPAPLAMAVAVPLAERFATVYPQVRLRFLTSHSAQVVEWIRRGQADIGLLYDVKLRRSIRGRPLLRDHLLLVTKRRDALNMEVIPFREVTYQPLILPSRQHGLRLLLEGLATQRGVSLAPVIEVDTLAIQIDLVLRGLGAAIVPQVAVYNELESGKLIGRPIVEPDVTRRLVLATALDRPLSLAGRRFASMVTNEVIALVRAGRWKGTLLRAQVSDETARPAVG